MGGGREIEARDRNRDRDKDKEFAYLECQNVISHICTCFGCEVDQVTFLASEHTSHN